VPVLGATGPFRPGETVHVRLVDALAGAPAVLALGTSTSVIANSPLPGLTSYCEPWSAVVPFVVPAAPGIGAGSGRLDLVAMLPAAVGGTGVCLQAGIIDPAGVSGVATSNGLELRIGF
jgi:hypothetical protein